jgi:chromosome segregation ATPase
LVETAIYVLLGALTTALLALIALPAVSRRAFRLAENRTRLTAPLSAAETQADRDALRGRHAIDLALAERRVAKAEDDWAAAQIALGERAADIVRRDTEIAEKAQDIARLREEVAALGREIEVRDAEIAAREVAMHDLAGQRDGAQQRFDEAIARSVERQKRFDELQANLDARIAVLARELGDLRGASDEALAAANARIADLKRNLLYSETNGTRLQEQAAALHDRLADAAMRENELSVRLQALSAARIEAEGAARVARAEREQAATDMSELRERLEAAQARLKTLDESDETLRRAIARLGRDIAPDPAPEEAPAEAARETAS